MITAIVISLIYIAIMFTCAAKIIITAIGVLINPHPKFSSCEKRFKEISPIKTQKMFQCEII